MEEEKKVNGIPPRSADTDHLMNVLRGIAVGETVSYSQLSDSLGVDVRKYRRGQLDSARRALEREEKITFETVREQGLRRIEGKEVVETHRDFRRRVRRAAGRQERRLACVGDFGKLDNETLREFNVAASIVGVFRHISSEKTQEKVKRQLFAESESRVPVAKVLEFFK